MPDPDDEPETSPEVRHCPLCDAKGYRGATVCDHIDHAPAARRGMIRVRAALAEARRGRQK